MKFDDYLKENKIHSANDLKDISENFISKSLEEVSIVTYIEVPEFYGESGKLSYTWIICENTVKLVFNGDSKEIEDDNFQFNNDVIELKSNDAYSKQDGVLYGKSHLAIQKGNADGTQKNVVELNDESSLKLYLTEDNSFLV